MELTDFLLARIAEDEAVAREAAKAARIEAWTYAGGWEIGEPYAAICEGTDAGQEVLPHIARWDPARVLAECEAKRRIVAEADVVSRMDDQIEGEWGNGRSVPWAEDEGVKLLRLLALPYAEHPDYDPAWSLADADAERLA